MQVQEQLRLLPDRPGVYLFRDEQGKVLYVGKARSLKSRVRSYFQAAKNLTAKVLSLVGRIHSIEHIVTDNEVEALVLESNLIKKHRPKYNVRLRDDKHYPYLRVSLEEQWPRLGIARRVRRDGSRYFGPYTTSTAVHETLRLLRRLFPLRTCKRVEDHTRPCLEYHIGRCIAPCKADFDQHDEYATIVRDLCAFLDGKHDAVVRRLRRRMEEAAEQLAFERAAGLRDQIQAIEKLAERQRVISPSLEDQDVIAFARGRDEVCVQVFFVRQGKLVDRDRFVLTGTDGVADDQVMAAFVQQRYSGDAFIPREVLVAVAPEGSDVIADWLSARRGARVRLIEPRRGAKRALVDLVRKNAAEGLAERQQEREQELAATEGAVADLQRFLDLAHEPWRIECFDISHTQGRATVGSMVVFEGGRPKTADYRRFQVRTAANDDYAAMHEVVARRFRRGLDERAQGVEGRFATLPDLVIIDGGKGQLNAALEALQPLGLGELPVFALAKEEEVLFAPGRSEPLVPPRGSHVLYLLQRVRDEAHRFALSYHRRLHAKSQVRSRLDDIPGIGPKRKQALLRHFGSLRRLREATVEQIAGVQGMSRALAEQLLEHLQ